MLLPAPLDVKSETSINSLFDFFPPSVVYCFGVFSLMMLSLLETILMMYLIRKDSQSQDNKAKKDQSLTVETNKKGQAKGGENNGNKQGGLRLEVTNGSLLH